MKKQDLVDGMVVQVDTRYERQRCAVVVASWAQHEQRTGGVYGPAKLTTVSGIGLAVASLLLPDGRVRPAEPKDLLNPSLTWEPLWLDSARAISSARRTPPSRPGGRPPAQRSVRSSAATGTKNCWPAAPVQPSKRPASRRSTKAPGRSSGTPAGPAS